MSLICMCNICGKTSQHGPITFNDGPMKLKVENYKGESYDIELKLKIQHSEDKETIQEAKNLSKISGMDDFKKIDDFMTKNKRIKHPAPHICVMCIRELTSKLVKEGQIDPKHDIDGSVPISFIPEGSLGGIKDSLIESDGVLYGNTEEHDTLADLIMKDLKSLSKYSNDDLPLTSNASEVENEFFDDDDISDIENEFFDDKDANDKLDENEEDS